MAGNLRSAYTAVIARGQWWDGPWESEPYEAAWAAEAIFFVRVLKVRGGAAAGASVEATLRIAAKTSRIAGPVPSMPSKLSSIPMHFIPYSPIAVLTTARITAFRPGASPPPVKIPICLYILRSGLKSKKIFYSTH